MAWKPVPEGAPPSPHDESPHAWMLPSCARAAKAIRFAHIPPWQCPISALADRRSIAQTSTRSKALGRVARHFADASVQRERTAERSACLVPRRPQMVCKRAPATTTAAPRDAQPPANRCAAPSIATRAATAMTPRPSVRLEPEMCKAATTEVGQRLMGWYEAGRRWRRWWPANSAPSPASWHAPLEARVLWPHVSMQSIGGGAMESGEPSRSITYSNRDRRFALSPALSQRLSPRSLSFFCACKRSARRCVGETRWPRACV